MAIRVIHRKPRRAFRPARRLFIETLESRDLLAVIRLVDWNTENAPNDAAADANFQTILEAIGSETFQGNTKRLDILAIQETDLAAGANSYTRIENILDTLYPTTDYASVVSALDGGGDATGFIYDTGTVQLLESIDVSPGSLTHSIVRGKFRPADTLRRLAWRWCSRAVRRRFQYEDQLGGGLFEPRQRGRGPVARCGRRAGRLGR
jgi:hypothetical protein